MIDKIEIHERSLDVQTISWEEYWKDTPAVFQKKVSELHRTWTIYIDNHFNPRYAHEYTDRYLSLISYVVKQYPSSIFLQRGFLIKLLGFENTILTFSGIKNAFAAMTSSFRNPIFLSFKKREYRNNSKNVPCLLPLITAVDNGIPMVFYHYRKQRILKNTDDDMLFFPAVDLNFRAKSFHGLEKLTRNFVLPWDPRITQRSQLITHKVLFPIITSIHKHKKGSLRFLDIGSGDGQFTSTIIGKILKSGLLGNNKIELTLLDVLMIDPSMQFSKKNLLHSLAKVEYICSDYSEWITNLPVGQCDRYDIVFLFLILHNVSHFKISAEFVTPDFDVFFRGRYKIYPYLSDYYRGLSLLFPEMIKDRTETGDMLYYPSRVFHEPSLVIHENHSLLETLCSISKGILIEDGDLTREILLDHLSQYSCNMLNVYDLSHYLRLSINLIYWITHDSDIPVGERIWPK